MPKWTEYTSKDTLADNDEVMLYDATGKANKRGLMSKFWNYVVDKMSTAVISKLETDNKTIIGAINALNGKSIKNLSAIYYDNRAILDITDLKTQDVIRIDFDTNLKNISVKKNGKFVGSTTLS
nr:MAG TPA: hypothetical protein [Caudoviricetes sp.]